ncbi:MAG: ASKHA domain-containing protein [Defluviitaleaceae bacterium]|nr:ASKHA domain-containing protein [Defluviitaleaceae bacterium]
MEITVWDNDQKQIIIAKKNQTVLQALQSADIFLEAVCGGGGTCGKCLVKIDGVSQLACQVMVAEGMEIVTKNFDQKDFAIVFDRANISVPASKKQTISSMGLAIDIGTTTIVFSLIDLETGKNAASLHGIMNSQRALGADVISRIKAANEGNLDALNKYVVEDIRQGIYEIFDSHDPIASFDTFDSIDNINRVVISGNTTMLHILMGMSCESLGQYPFTPVFIDLQKHTFKELFGAEFFYSNRFDLKQFGEKLLTCDVTLLPGISTYVGSDIVAGVSYCYSLKEEGTCLLVDLGTNGELALFSQDTIVCTATAAGPAFEAANISCGTVSVSGAIYKAVYNPTTKSFEYETLNNQNPIGLCGSGVLDVASQLVLHGIIDETGALDEEFIVASGTNGADPVIFTPKDVRELQLAKSAVRAGIEVLLAETQTSYEDVKKVYLAGGFGSTFNLESALILGLLPEEWRYKVEPLSNTSLKGCEQALADPSALDRIISVALKAKEINLSDHPQFNDLFMDHMMF